MSGIASIVKGRESTRPQPNSRISKLQRGFFLSLIL